MTRNATYGYVAIAVVAVLVLGAIVYSWLGGAPGVPSTGSAQTQSAPVGGSLTGTVEPY